MWFNGKKQLKYIKTVTKYEAIGNQWVGWVLFSFSEDSDTLNEFSFYSNDEKKRKKETFRGNQPQIMQKKRWSKHMNSDVWYFYDEIKSRLKLFWNVLEQMQNIEYLPHSL